EESPYVSRGDADARAVAVRADGRWRGEARRADGRARAGGWPVRVRRRRRAADVVLTAWRGDQAQCRKNQARKVVCIPAPAAAVAGKTTGEVVPSDLWAWRKYGQKPIKGSPYPRGYYRCSSSKGCPARKQVERSRTDPNMLVITYTSEHNHPWPTQRNVLAGSTRSHYAKNSSNTDAASSKNSKNSSRNQHKPVVKAESKDQ
uniref:WRKY domain-containing protein n=1 Tax=Aegilops tauschii subsp. strangulata TaxID=200361 RepID=A0A453PBU9_AEGTS